MVRIKINPLFLLTAFLFVIVGLYLEMLLAFCIVFLHEIAHVIMAKIRKYKILKVEIFPFGAMAEYQGLLEMDPVSEIKIALAGPFLNLFFAVVGWFIGLELFFKYNLIIALFNLIPALPLDGGRVLRAILVKKYGLKTGTKLAVKAARFFAVAGFIIGLIGLLRNESNLLVLFIAFFVYGAAVKEKNNLFYNIYSYLSKRKDYIKRQQVKNVFCRVIRENILLKDVISIIIPDKYNIFYVLDSDSKIIAMLSETNLLDAFFSQKDKVTRIIDIIEE